MTTSLLNHGGGFLGLLGVVQGMYGAVTFMYSFLTTFQTVSIRDSGSIVQSTDGKVYIISSIFTFQTFGLTWGDTSSLLTTKTK